MALLKFGAIVTEGSGSLGGHTIQNSRGGMQLRNKPIPRSAPTAAQYAIRSINPVLQAGWKALTDAQRLIWNNFAQDYGIMNANDDHHPLSGHSLWMKYQFVYLFEGFPFQPNPVKAKIGPLGPEMIKNGTFDNSDYWTTLLSWEISGGKANYTGIGNDMLSQSFIGIIGLNYRVKWDLLSSVAQSYFLPFLFGTGILFTFPFDRYRYFASGSYSYDVQAIVSFPTIGFLGNLNQPQFSIDNLSIKQIL